VIEKLLFLTFKSPTRLLLIVSQVKASIKVILIECQAKFASKIPKANRSKKKKLEFLLSHKQDSFLFTRK